MNVDLRLPPEWDIVVSADGSVRATCSQDPGLEIVAVPLTPTIEAKVEWARLVLRQQLDLPADAGDEHIKTHANEKGTTVDGWPAWFIVAERAEAGEPRAFAFYYFLDYSAYAQIRGPGVTAHLDLLRRARPNYATEEVVALEQLWR